MALNEERVQGDRPRLGCGRDLDELWASIDDAPTAHELICEDCRHARSALQHLASVTESMRERDREDPDLQPGQRVREAIMMVARAEIRRGRRAPLTTTPLGTIDISEQALTSLIRFAASTLPGVHARRCTVSTVSTDVTASSQGFKIAATDPVDVDDVRITLQVALASTVKIPATMVLLRERVGTVVQAQTSITMKQINIVVEDLYDV
ncbi:Asp23/Gls24 family envelope stress response protein [Arthrobacter cheniae]|uniref:Asp23/Gls24 family envelope stress response protein n=1 Tax=Arthrobacter cheniae TaxID=1258888 RepID=A0A3A5LXN2_9MICC|nr:Asp23/Gls24 family envelope stress response protein [Arthrobacter cheniae]